MRQARCLLPTDGRGGHEGLRGAAGRCGGNASPQTWRTSGQRSTGSSHDVMPMGAMSLASGMAWLWFITSDYVEGALWLGDALEAKGPRSGDEEPASTRSWTLCQHTAVG